MSNTSNLDDLRHSAAHLLAAAVKMLWPGTHNAIGPAIENGFYQDFDFGEHKITEADLPIIEKKMLEILPSWTKFVFNEVTLTQAKILFKDNPYKIELAEEFASEGKKLQTNDPGDFLDLCKMGHVENPSKELRHFKLLSIAGAYWRGSEKNKMLTRIYGTIFPTDSELDKHLFMLEEAKKRDHKKLGIELDLFVFSDLVGPGLPLWTPKGTILRELLDGFVWSLRREKGYQRVEIPHITKKELYETSGHWDKFKDELFKIITREGHEFAMKPMNCPHHTQIYASRPRSYKELPIRYANTTTCYRDEQTGELAGLSRVRAFTQDDAHVFCRYEDIEAESLVIWEIINKFYSAFGFDLKIRLSLHDPTNMKSYLGSEENWKKAESILRSLLTGKKTDFYEAIGEAAFYGPKIDFMTHDSLGREWQVATIQLDMNMPDRFELNCINNKGEEERIIMIHAAIMGSIDRFLSILIEHYVGIFPLWLAPVQVMMLPVADRHHKIAEKAAETLRNEGIRVEVNTDNKTLPAKIRDGSLQKIPYLCIIGDKEIERNDKINVAVRTQDGRDLGMSALYEFLDRLKKDIEKKN